MSFRVTYAAGRRAWPDLRWAYFRRRRVEWCLHGSDNTRAYTDAVERMRRVEDEACYRHGTAAERLALLWDGGRCKSDPWTF